MPTANAEGLDRVGRWHRKGLGASLGTFISARGLGRSLSACSERSWSKNRRGRRTVLGWTANTTRAIVRAMLSAGVLTDPNDARLDELGWREWRAMLRQANHISYN